MTKRSRWVDDPTVEVFDEWGESAVFERGRPVATLVRHGFFDSFWTDSRTILIHDTKDDAVRATIAHYRKDRKC